MHLPRFILVRDCIEWGSTAASADYYCCGSFISAGRETAAGRLEVDGIRLHNDNGADDLRSHLFADPTEVGFEQPDGNAISFSSYLNQNRVSAFHQV